MKLSIKLSVLFLIITQYSYAQEGFRIGPTASYFFSKPIAQDSLPNEFSFRFKSGYNGGLSLYYGFSNKFGITTNALFTSKGYRVFNDSNRHGTTLKRNQMFIEIPVYFVFRQKFNGVSYIRENIGVSFSSLISSSKKEISNENGSYRIVEENKNTFYPMLHAGIEVGNENKVGNVFVFGVHYRYAFATNTTLGIHNNKTSTTPYFNLGFRGSYLGVSLTYQFNLKNLKREEEFFY